MSFRESLYQLEVIDFTKRDKGIRETLFNTSLVDFNTDRKMKVADIALPMSSRPILRWAKNSESAKRWAKKFGTVISCFKVDRTKYLENIEHLNLNQDTLNIEVASNGIIGVETTLEISVDK